MTTVFIHIYPRVGPKIATRKGFHPLITPELTITMYRTEAEAEQVRQRVGGLVIETTADKLKGRITDGVSVGTADAAKAYEKDRTMFLHDFLDEFQNEAIECYQDEHDLAHPEFFNWDYQGTEPSAADREWFEAVCREADTFDDGMAVWVRVEKPTSQQAQ